MKKLFITIFAVLSLTATTYSQKSYIDYLRSMPVFITSCLNLVNNGNEIAQVDSLYNLISLDIKSRYFRVESSSVQSELRNALDNKVSIKFTPFLTEAELLSLKADSCYIEKITPLLLQLKDSSKMTVEERGVLDKKILDEKFNYCKQFNGAYNKLVNDSFKLVTTLTSEIILNNDYEPEEKELLQISALRSHLYIMKDSRKYNILTADEIVKKLYK